MMRKIIKRMTSFFLVITLFFSYATIASADYNTTTDGVFMGTLEDYVTTVIINGDDSPWISEITVDGKKYNVENKVISLTQAQKAEGKKIVFMTENNQVVRFCELSAVGKTEPSVIIYPVEFIYSNGSFDSKKASIEGVVENFFNTHHESWAESALIDNNLSVLNNISVTLKSSNVDALFFKNGLISNLSEITFDVSGEVIAGGTTSFDKKIYVNKQYEFPSNTQSMDIEVECILQALIDETSVCASSKTKIKLINNDFGKRTNWEKKSVKELLKEMQSYVPLFEANTGRLSGLSYDISAVLIAHSIGEMASSMEAADTVYEMGCYYAGVKYCGVKEAGKMFLDAVMNDTDKEVQKIINSTYDILKNNPYFDEFIIWYESFLDNKSGTSTKYSVYCPTDVTVTEENDIVVLSIKNDVVEFCESYISAFVVDGKKTFYLPSDTDYTITITATDNGTMDYSICEYTSGGLERTIGYYDVPLVKDESYTATAPKESMLDASEYNLSDKNGNEIECDFDSLPPVEDEIVDVVISEELFDGFSKELIDKVANAMFSFESVVNITSYNISTDDTVALFSAIAKYYPTEYSLLSKSDFTYKITFSPSLGCITNIRFYYSEDANLEVFEKRAKDLNAEINKLVARVEGMSDFEKALYFHDYIVLHSEYDLELLEILETEGTLSGELRSERYTEYSILVNGTGICGSYALAYRALLNAAGVECLYLSSLQMNHAWNLVKLDGNWYHVDCCWDDPIPDTYGVVRRTYFLRTDSEIMDLKHYSWSPGKYKATSTAFSEMNRAYDTTQKYDESTDLWYYIKGTSLYKSDKFGNNESEVATISATSLDATDGNIYFSNGRAVYLYDTESSSSKLAYQIPNAKLGSKESKAYIKNLYVDGNVVDYYKVIYNENNEASTVLESGTLDIENYAKITGVELDLTELTLNVFENKTLTATPTTESVDTLSVDLMWSSSNETVADVDQSGNITARNIGNTTITAQIENFKATCELTVTGDSLTGMCGENITWSFDTDTKTLSFSGNGTMLNFANSNSSVNTTLIPWYGYKAEIEKAVIEEGITNIGDGCFYRCENLLEASIPQTVLSIGKYAFAYCTVLSGVTFSNNLKSIMEYAFEDCDGLRSIIIPDSVTYLGGCAFAYCSNLESVIIGDGVKQILSQVFYGCEKLKNLSLPKDLTSIESAAFCDSSLESITIPNKVTRIARSVFENTNIREIIIPDSVKEIGSSVGSGVFQNCSNLEYVYLGKGLNSLASNSFRNCNKLTKFVISQENTSYCVEDGVVFSKDKTELVVYPSGKPDKCYVIPDGVKKVYASTFSDCNNIDTLVISKDVTELHSVSGTIGVGGTSFGLFLFDNMNQLSAIIVSDENEVYSSENGVLFNKDKTVLFKFPNNKSDVVYTPHSSVNTLFPGAFTNAKNLKSLIIPDSVTKFGRTSYIILSFPNTSIEYIFLEGQTELYIGQVNQYSSLKKIYTLNAVESDYKNSFPDGSSVYSTNGSVAQRRVFTNRGQTFVDINAEPHVHDYFLMGYVAPTETEDGYEYWECYCGNDSYKNILHRYGEQETLEATCGSTGEVSKKCQNCNHIEIIETIPASGNHDYKFSSTTPGTCTTSPIYHYECAVCGDAYDKTGDSDGGHNYTKEIVLSTCTEKGYTKSVCTICEESVIYDFTSPKGHKLKIVNSDSYCAAHDTIEYSCTVCDYKEAVAADTSKLETTTVVENPTCTNSGTKCEICNLCNATVSMEFTKPLGHAFGEWVLTTPPTVETEGEETCTCSRCSTTKTQAVPKLEETQRASLIISNDTAHPGETVKVAVSISDNPGIVAALLKISYDTEKLTLVSVENGEIFANGDFEKGNDLSAMPYTVLWLDATAKEDYTADGKLLTLTFKVADDAPVGDTEISITYDEKSTFNAELQPVSFSVENGTVTIKNRIPGDANGDDELNLKDVVAIRRYLAGGWGIEIDESNADVDGSGDVNLVDAALITRFLADWDVTLV